MKAFPVSARPVLFVALAALAVLAASSLLAGCGAAPQSEPENSKNLARRAGVEDSALETDLCSEHRVLRPVCTQCNPKLAVVFRAKGDFCEEHGQPMSICPVHHPERHGRPQVDVSTQVAPADRTRLRFKDARTARLAGFETAVARPDRGGEAIPATATLVVDATRRADVAAGAPGTVRRILVEEGTRVAAGEALARLESAALAEARSRLESASAAHRNAAAALERARALLEKGMTARRDYDDAEQAEASARAEVAAAAGALQALGGGADAGGTLVVRTPIAGIVTRRLVVVGRYVEAEESMFEIVDPSRLDAELEIGERHAARVAVGDSVSIHTAPGDAEPVTGVLTYVAPIVDETSRVVRARARLGPAGPSARVNAVHRATIRARAASGAVVVPRQAVQDVKGASVAFVRLTEESYEVRRVETRPAAGGALSVRRGLAPGEQVVTTGSYLLLTETDKSAIGAGCCDVEPPSR